MSNKNGKWVYQKYKVTKLNIVFMVALLVVSLIITIACVYLETNAVVPASSNSKLSNTQIFYLEYQQEILVIKEIFMITSSILSSSFIIELLFEAKNKNSMYTDFFVQEVVYSPEFYKKLPKEDRRNILETINSIENPDSNKVVAKMHENLKQRLSQSISQTQNQENLYYMTSCSYKVVCNTKHAYFEKRVTRVMNVRSYREKEVISDFRLGAYKNKSIQPNGIKEFELLSLSIDGRPIDLSKIGIKDIGQSENALEVQSEYNYRKQYIYKDTITFYNNRDVAIAFEYISRTDKSDNFSVFRSATPCEKFSVDFSVDGTYRVIPIAFGFCDNAHRSPNTQNKKDAYVVFNDWIFEDDGVVIIINPY